MMVELIIYFICFVVCLINFSWIYARLNKKKFNIHFKDVVLVIMLALLSSFFVYKNLGYLKMIFSILSCIIFNYLKYRDNKNKIIIFSLLIWLTGILLDIIFMNIFSLFLYNSTFGLFFIKYIATFVLQVLHNLLFCLDSFKNLICKLYKIFAKIGLEFLFITILSLIFFDLKISLNIGNIKILSFYFIAFSFCIILQIRNVYLQKYYKSANQILEDNSKLYIQEGNETRTFRHNLLSKLQSIKNVGNVDVNIMIDEIITECLNLNLHNNEFDKIPRGINGFIEQKLLDLKEYDYSILINNQICGSLIDIIGPKKYVKFCDILGIALDNAVEALKATSEKILYIDFEDNNNYIKVELRNTFSNIIDLDKIGKINYSTKSSKRGIGLFSIFNSRSNNVTFKIVNNFFVTAIIVSK